MPTIAANTYRLPVLDKLARGSLIIAMSSDNPAVPGNDAAVARLAAAQAALDAAEAAFRTIHNEAALLLTQRDTAIAAWNSAINGLAALTESLTEGDPTKILSAGFDVRSPKTPEQPVPPIENVRVTYAFEPGYSEITWKALPNATAYRLQSCTGDPFLEEWRESGVTIEAKYLANGATPGQPCWYRVAAINRRGQGPWSNPAPRPVM